MFGSDFQDLQILFPTLLSIPEEDVSEATSFVRLLITFQYFQRQSDPEFSNIGTNERADENKEHQKFRKKKDDNSNDFVI